ncbi:MAG: PLDc N-terminal domain-containing protein [Phycisphaerae bacterium]|nr:PLDc N-terminal domain-containing protein [Phycisphaerae bacterium]
MLLNMSFPFWPMRPIFEIRYLTGLLAVAGVVFTVIMLIDCLKREPEQFAHPISTAGKYDKIIWALAMAISLSLYFIGTIVYFFVVYLGKKDSDS